ncbi:3-dehydroquinate synthase [Leucobacter luti]|uniref:3-dehydroquinate synthase n=1 Tax=Leucobacter luti TaxID=340320 RepID=UPI0010498E7B|nr:3-dehydroquinate synthase [Leucobacter luti]MCW2287924.1 3-dehydroquinate synthase [Leucobacter luti]TCK45914.1 3-dehydroquinate synthase [Leucobacter luti]
MTEQQTTEIQVTGENEYSVLVGRGVIDRVPEVLGDRVAKVLIVHTPTVGKIASDLRDALQGRYDQVLLAEVPDAESAKRVEVAAFCWQILGQSDFTRTDAVIGLGGGAVTDLAGFVAATWLRGVKLVQIPTSVLGMVDASIGGKTGINTTEGKNLVGSFYAPAGVICDLDLLDSLPRNEVLAGFAEIAKCGFIAEPEILELLEADVDRATDPATPEFQRLVELAIGVKARVVSEDFREGGLREILNYGHTLGHAIEHAERYQWRHGVAISIGMMYAAELGRMAGALSDEAVDRHRRILSSLTLPLHYPAGRWQGLLATMQRDKKARAGMLRFIVLDDIGKPRVLAGVDDSMLQFAYQEIAS